MAEFKDIGFPVFLEWVAKVAFLIFEMFIAFPVHRLIGCHVCHSQKHLEKKFRKKSYCQIRKLSEYG